MACPGTPVHAGAAAPLGKPSRVHGRLLPRDPQAPAHCRRRTPCTGQCSVSHRLRTRVLLNTSAGLASECTKGRCDHSGRASPQVADVCSRRRKRVGVASRIAGALASGRKTGQAARRGCSPVWLLRPFFLKPVSLGSGGVRSLLTHQNRMPCEPEWPHTAVGRICTCWWIHLAWKFRPAVRRSTFSAGQRVFISCGRRWPHSLTIDS